MPPLTEGGGGRHDLAGSRTAVALGARDRERPERLARMRTAQVQAAARVRIPPLRDPDETPVPVAEKVGRTSEGVCLCVAKYLVIDDADRALHLAEVAGRRVVLDGAGRALGRLAGGPGEPSGRAAAPAERRGAGSAAEPGGRP